MSTCCLIFSAAGLPPSAVPESLVHDSHDTSKLVGTRSAKDVALAEPIHHAGGVFVMMLFEPEHVCKFVTDHRIFIAEQKRNTVVVGSSVNAWLSFPWPFKTIKLQRVEKNYKTGTKFLRCSSLLVYAGY
jgi:hypothetical protein